MIIKKIDINSIFPIIIKIIKLNLDDVSKLANFISSSPNIADVVVFDLEKVRDVAEYTDPHHYSEGMVHVFVNGVPVVSDGAFTGQRPGRVLRKGN